VFWLQMWWWEEAGLSQAEAMLTAVPWLGWRAWAGHCGVLRARRRTFVQVNCEVLLFLLLRHDAPCFIWTLWQGGRLLTRAAGRILASTVFCGLRRPMVSAIAIVQAHCIMLGALAAGQGGGV
jgi:hypothetical protein